MLNFIYFSLVNNNSFFNSSISTKNIRIWISIMLASIVVDGIYEWHVASVLCNVILSVELHILAWFNSIHFFDRLIFPSLLEVACYRNFLSNTSKCLFITTEDESCEVIFRLLHVWKKILWYISVKSYLWLNSK